MPLATFVIAFAAVALLLFSRSQRTKLRVIAVASITGALFLPAILAPLSNSAEGGSIRIASIQGNANAGLFSNSARGTFLMHHIDEARKFLATGEDFDVMVWPENSADIDVLGSETDRLVISNFVNNELHRPLIFGTITKRDGEYFNSSLYWLPGSEMADWYDKQRPVPFAEYVPDREFWRKISSLVDMVPIGYSFGTRDGIFISDHGRLGTLICFEIAVDEIPRTLVSDGAQLILSQTNNADFGHSDEAFQQLGIARLRAIETGRAVINVSTVGPSAVILPSGELAQYVSEFKPGFMSFDVPLRDSRTPAQFISLPFDLANLGLTVIGVIFLTLAPRIRGRSA